MQMEILPLMHWRMTMLGNIVTRFVKKLATMQRSSMMKPTYQVTVTVKDQAGKLVAEAEQNGRHGIQQPCQRRQNNEAGHWQLTENQWHHDRWLGRLGTVVSSDRSRHLPWSQKTDAVIIGRGSNRAERESGMRPTCPAFSCPVFFTSKKKSVKVWNARKRTISKPRLKKGTKGNCVQSFLSRCFDS